MIARIAPRAARRARAERYRAKLHENLGQAATRRAVLRQGQGPPVGLRPGGGSSSRPRGPLPPTRWVSQGSEDSTFTMSSRDAICEAVGNGTLATGRTTCSGEPTRWVPRRRSFSEVFYSGLYPGNRPPVPISRTATEYDTSCRGAGTHPASGRVRCIRGLSVDLRIQRPDDTDGRHHQRVARPVFSNGASSDAGCLACTCCSGGAAASRCLRHRDRPRVHHRPGVVYITLLELCQEYILLRHRG